MIHEWFLIGAKFGFTAFFAIAVFFLLWIVLIGAFTVIGTLIGGIIGGDDDGSQQHP